MHPLRFIAALLLAGFLNTAVGQSAGPQSTPAAGPAQSIPAPNVPVLQTNVNLVLVDVVVTNHGKAVHDLNQSQFHIFEDGREQTITSFDEHMPEAGPAVAAKPVPLPPHVYSNVPEYAQGGAVNVLLLDALNTPMSDQLEVRHQMIQYMGKISPGTSLAIFTLASRLQLVQGFTTNVAALVKAIQNKKAGVKQSIVLDSENTTILDTMGADVSQAWESSQAAIGMLQFQADLTAYMVDQRVGMTIDAMEQLARYLSAIPGRKNLIWFSGSFPIELDPDAALRSPFQAMRSYSSQLKDVSDLLSAARVAVYPVDARGLLTMPASDASYSAVTSLTDTSGQVKTRGIQNIAASQPGTGPVRDNKSFLRELQASQAGMVQIADQTGGKAYVNTNGLKEAVANAVENGSSYYTIGYDPVAKDFNGQYRKLLVQVDHCDCQLAYREGYYADSPDKPAANLPATLSPMMAAVLRGAPPATQILFQARVLPATDPLFQGAKLPDSPGMMAATLKKTAHRYVVDLIVDAHALVFNEMPNGTRQTRIEVALVAYDADGNRVNYLDPSYTVKFRPEQFAQLLAKGIRMRVALDLPVGPVSLRIAVCDVGAGRTGSLEVPMDIAAR
jgi:VWFA-related protein